MTHGVILPTIPQTVSNGMSPISFFLMRVAASLIQLADRKSSVVIGVRRCDVHLEEVILTSVQIGP
jgi:hypothetical protein